MMFRRCPQIAGPAALVTAISCFCLVVLIASSPGGDEASSKAGPLAKIEKNLIVHEWGVLLHGFAGKRHVLAPPTELLETLPGFAYRNDDVSPLVTEPLSWRKPVIHFYGTPGTEVEVTIKTAEGYPLAYYPFPTTIKRTLIDPGPPQANNGLTCANSLHWSGTLSKEPPAGLAGAPAGHWWNTARKIPGDYFTTKDQPKAPIGGQTERFLSYEATAERSPAIEATVKANVLRLKNTQDSKVYPRRIHGGCLFRAQSPSARRLPCVS